MFLWASVLLALVLLSVHLCSDPDPPSGNVGHKSGRTEADKAPTRAAGPNDTLTTKKSPQFLGLATIAENQRRSIWDEQVLAERRARRDAGAVYPLRYSLLDTLRIGTVVPLIDTISLMPEYDPKDVLAAMARRRTVLPGATARVVGIAVSKDGFLWYEAEISAHPIKTSETTEEGWVIADALMRQMPAENADRNQCLADSLGHTYIQALLRKHNIGRSQLDSISSEAQREQWPLPDVE